VRIIEHILLLIQDVSRFSTNIRWPSQILTHELLSMNDAFSTVTRARSKSLTTPNTGFVKILYKYQTTVPRLAYYFSYLSSFGFRVFGTTNFMTLSEPFWFFVIQKLTGSVLVFITRTREKRTSADRNLTSGFANANWSFKPHTGPVISNSVGGWRHQDNSGHQNAVLTGITLADCREWKEIHSI